MIRKFSTTARQRTAALLVTLAIPLAACGGAASNEPGTTNDGTGNWEDEADREAILRSSTSLTTPGFSGSFDPVKSVVGTDILIGRLIYGTLTYQTPEGPEPWLAESWEIVDDTTLDLHIREGVTFHNGEVFDAAAVKAGLDRNRAEGTPFTAAFETLENIEVVDDLTLRVTTNRPAAGGLLATLSGREGLIPAPASLAAPETMDSAPIGAGPFAVEEWNSGESLKLRKYEGYFDQDEYAFGGIDFQAVTDPVAVRNAILAGDLDLGVIDKEGVEALEANPNTGSQVNPSDAGYYVNLNTSLSDPPLDNLKVRQALNHAFNREEVAESIFGAEPKWQFFPEGSIGHDPDLEGYYEYDPDKAKELLAEAGYPDGFSMTMQAFPQPNPSARAAEVLKSNLADVGVELTIASGPNMTQDYHLDKRTDAGQNWWIPRTDPTLTFLTLYGPVGVINTSQYDNPELNDLVYGIQGETDPEVIDQGLQEASRMMVEEAREIGVAHTPSYWGFSSKVGFKDGTLHDFGTSPTGADLSSIYIKK